MILRFMSFLVATAMCAAPILADAPRTSVPPQIRPGTEPVAIAPVRPVLRPVIASADAPEVGDIPPATVAAETPAAPGTAAPETETPELATAEEPAPTPEADDPVVEIAVSRLAVSPLPIPRPRVVFRTRAPESAPEVVPVAATKVTRVAPPRPEKRTKGLLAAIFNAPNKPTKYPREGSVCGDPAIRGQAVPPIPAKLRGCGLADPVRVTAVDGIVLSTPATISCQTAVALRRWVSGTVKPTVGKHGGGLAGLKVAASYSCRTRNNVPGAKVSEHGRGKAIDISALILKDGTAMTVLRGWRNKVQGPILKAVHAKACGTFGTVLGPNSDRYHQDHFHFDVASHGYGAYCR